VAVGTIGTVTKVGGWTNTLTTRIMRQIFATGSSVELKSPFVYIHCSI